MAATYSVSIVTHNHAPFIGACLSSLLAKNNSIRDSVRVLVWDNNSKDATTTILKQFAQKHPQIQIIQCESNIGFGAGHNRLLERVDSQYHFVCNPDVEFVADSIVEMAESLKTNPKVGLVCPRVEFPGGELQQLNKRDPRVLDLALRRFVPTRWQVRFKERIDEYEMRDMPADQSYEVPFVSGCFFGIRTDLFKELRGFDERFFAYFEDADLSRRLRQRGFHNLYLPNTRIIHHWQRANRRSLRGTWIFSQSACKYFQKWGWTL